MDEYLVRLNDISKSFEHKKALSSKMRRIIAVDHVSLDIPAGSILGLVGESGCGKSTVGKLAAGLLQPDSGFISFENIELSTASQGWLHQLRSKMQFIFQDPGDSFDPRFTVKQIISEGFSVFYHTKSALWKKERILEVLDTVKLRSDLLNRYPHELSGGERQRIGIARSLILDPAFIVCDEPVSSLDVSVQANILNVLLEIQRKNGLTYLFISHDLSVVRYMSTDVAVMYLGKILEKAPVEELFLKPVHPYTQALFAAVPSYKKRALKNDWKPVAGDVPDPLNVPSGCAFHPRCPYKMDICSQVVPETFSVGKDHTAVCHLCGK